MKKSKLIQTKFKTVDLSDINGGRCETTSHSFLGRTWTKTVCYNDIDGDKESVCRNRDYEQTL